MRTLTRLAIAAAIALPALGATGGAAEAAACPAGLTVAGIALTGADCVDVGNGELELEDPKLLSQGAVGITGRMILNVSRTELRAKTPAVPLPISVRRSDGSITPFMLGTPTVGTFEICDIPAAQPPTGGTLIEPSPEIEGDTPSVLTADRLNIVQGVSVGCRTGTAIRITQPTLKAVGKLLGFALSTQIPFSEGTSIGLPNTFALDEERGGRVVGSFSIALPIKSTPVAAALRAEISRDGGLAPVGGSFQYQGLLMPIPGIVLKNPFLTIDPSTKTFGGGVRISVPAGFGIFGSLLLQDGALKSIGADVALPGIGFPVAQPPILTVRSIGFTFTKGGTTVGPFGTTITSPSSFQGRASFQAGPIVPLPSGSFAAIVGDVDLTIAGPVVQLRGTLTGLNRLITLGQARVLFAASPFRFEAQARAAFPSVNAPVFDGQVFVGATASAFTGLGTVVMQIPSQVPIIGGQKLGGFSAVVSNKAAAGVIFVDPPLLKPRNIGVAFQFGGGFSLIDSVTPFITVTPTQSLGRSLAGVRSTFGAAGAGFEIAAGTGDVVVQVKGASGKPTGVSITGPDGRKVTTTPLPSGDPAVLQLAIAKPKAGTHTVRGNGIAEVQVATLDDPTYLDPRPGFGTRAQAPITAGTPVPVCWDLKNAPAGAVVDLFEDTNGFAATGRDIATDLPASGCFDIPTTDWEPGKHWAYGIVRVGDDPLTIRYWPIGIVVTDPSRLPAPTALKATRTKDGATVAFKAVEGATGYVVIATPANPQDAPQHKATVFPTAKPSVELSLRGAASWKVVVQAIDAGGRLGNVSRDVATGPLVPVVLAGTPNGTPQVGEPWAFDLDVQNVKTIKLLASPKGTKLNRATGLLTWTPSAKAATVAPQLLKVQGCSADGRCVTQEWFLSAYGAGFSPAGPARGFAVLDSVVKPGETIELRAQGIDEGVTVKVDGKRVKATVLDQNTVAIVLPKGLKKGAHDVSFRIGSDLEETRKGAIVVL